MSVQSKLIIGDIKTFERVYNKYFDQVYSVILRYTRDETFADDLLQEVFIKLWNNKAKVSEDLTIEHQIFVITKNVVLNHLKKSVREKRLIADYKVTLMSSFANHHTFSEERLNKLKNLIDSLPEKQQQVFKMHKLEGLSYEEIAQSLKISKNTVSSHLSAAVKSLKKNNLLLIYILISLN
ncbi:RNA polymerase sigma factor [Zhouia amylolytica]|uniref:HTH luxR-type domain-containing protein n=1 Tax=Zhouia amylolytica AD3 TaxID=1286632 RepID=W2UR59_9FLAO|nr:sigma-70 family RNA polymerase sigma factor [Zhouia amylolytica]ETN96429.1 hypothetical protein P278_06970 [Zhouia amylolytica AD3]